MIKTTVGNMIIVVYKCWCCGEVITVFEETDLPIPKKEVWNLCPGCKSQGTK